MRELKEVFRRYRSRPIEQVISLINPVLRGWVNYFAVGHSSECFSFIKDWVEKKVRRQMAHARKRKGFGWDAVLIDRIVSAGLRNSLSGSGIT
jgi:RNA-directed DNA polymerase